MPHLSEESVALGMSHQFLERHRGASTKAFGGCVWFWFECTRLLPPLLKFLLPSQLLKVKQGYSPSVVYFLHLLSRASTTKPQWWKQSQRVCGVWVCGMPRGLHARGKTSPEQGLGWLETALKFIIQGCSHQICRNGKGPLVQVKQSPLENEPEVTIFAPSS